MVLKLESPKSSFELLQVCLHGSLGAYPPLEEQSTKFMVHITGCCLCGAMDIKFWSIGISNLSLPIFGVLMLQVCLHGSDLS